MNKKLVDQLTAYLTSLKASNPGADFTAADSALASLTSSLEVLDPADAMLDAMRRGAGLADDQPAGPPDAGDPEIAAFAAAVRRGARLPD